MSLASLRDEEKYTKDGFIIASIYWTKNLVLEDEQRYINPKIEQEPAQFKEKIAVRKKNGQILSNYTFPRLTDYQP